MYALTGNTVAALLPVIDHEKRNAVLSGIGLVKEYDDQGLALGTDGKAAAIMRIRAERGNVWNIILSSDMAEALAQLPDAEWTIYGGLKKQAKEEEEGRLRLVQACARLPDGATVSVIGRRIDGTYPTFEQARRKETGQTLILPDAELVADLAKTVRKAHGHLLRVGLKGVDATAGNGSVVVAGVVPGMSGPIDGTTLDPVKLRQIAEVLRLAGIKGQTEWTRSGVGRGWTFHADGFEAILMPVYTETGLAEPGDVPDIPIVQAQAAAAPKARKVTASGKHNAQLEKLRAILRECKTEDGALAMQNHEAAVRRLRHINSLIESVTTE
jgi:hypothetical protein